MAADRVRIMQVVQHAALGGGTLMAMVLAERLDCERYDVAIAIGPQAGPEGSLLEEMRARGLRILTIPHLRRSPHPVCDVCAAWELGRAIADWRPDIIHTHGSKPRLLVPPVSSLGGTTVKIGHIWGWEWQPARNVMEEALYVIGARLGAEAYNTLIACSAAMRDQGLARGVGHPEQYEVVPPSIDLEEFNPSGRDAARASVLAEAGIAPEAFVVGSVMRLAAQKAPEVLVQAAAILAPLAPTVHWLVVGGGPLESRLRELIAQHHLQSRMHLLGPRRDVARLLRACDAFALASDWEPFGIVYLEAAAVGLPVVGTRVDGAPEAVVDGETGILVEPRRPAALAAAIMRLVKDPQLARRMGRAGMRRARQFGHERFVSKVAEIYERLLAVRNTPAYR